MIIRDGTTTENPAEVSDDMGRDGTYPDGDRSNRARTMSFALSERDLDLIQLEELHAESGYSGWFADRIGLSGYEFISARHSVSATVNGSNGETDLMVLFGKTGSKVAVLIEDKISAAFTHRQAERYMERGENLVGTGEVDAFKTVLIAPRLYMASVPLSDPWQERIILEDITAWFGNRSGHHFRWRFDALNRVIQKISRNLSASREDIAQFSRALSLYIERTHAPNLSHNPGRDPNGPTIRFPGSSPKLQLWWKVATNQMILQLGEGYQGLAQDLDLPAGIDLESAHDNNRSSDYLVAPVPPVEFSAPFEAQIPIIEEALGKALKLISVVPRLERIRQANG